MVLRRKLAYHLIQTYMVSSVFLTISWLALFLPPASIAERLAIAMTILLTLTSMFASERRWEQTLNNPIQITCTTPCAAAGPCPACPT